MGVWKLEYNKNIVRWSLSRSYIKSLWQNNKAVLYGTVNDYKIVNTIQKTFSFHFYIEISLSPT